MKKAVVVGGSNGIGLGISRRLAADGYHIVICDLAEPAEGAPAPENYDYIYTDLRFYDEELFAELSRDEDVSVLMITAGIGRIADFEAHHIAEIDKFMTVNAVSVIKILRAFYPRMASGKAFHTGVMGSISGWLSSPAASVYAASKAGVVRFIESVNIELECSGTANRILDVSPGSFKGSRFYGGKNDLQALSGLADEIVSKLFSGETRFIPGYEETFSRVLERYHDNPHDFGKESYEYKKSSGRLDNSDKAVIGYLSGTFDLFHIGHLNLLKRAKQQCDYLIVGVHNSGAWKGKETFISLEERKEIVRACRYVDKVVDSCPEDSDAWYLWHYNRLFVGSDYKGTERFNRYEEFFADKNVKIVYFPYTKSTSSTQLRKAIDQRG